MLKYGNLVFNLLYSPMDVLDEVMSMQKNNFHN